MTLSFRGIAITGCTLCLAAALLWTLAPQQALHLWEIDPSEATTLVARRYAAILGGVATILFAARNAEPSTARQAISLGCGVACMALCVNSIVDWLHAEVGLAMLCTIVIESILASCFIVLWHADGEALVAAENSPRGLSTRD